MIGDLLRTIPDEPRWIDTRGVLLDGRCSVLADADGAVVRSVDYPFVGVVGSPGAEHLEPALKEAGPAVEVLVQHESLVAVRGMLAGWREEDAIVHRLPVDVEDALPVPPPAVRFLGDADRGRLEHVPDPTRAELLAALGRVPFAAWFEDGRPVSFCYAAVRTETLWDASVDTLAAFRGRGLAGGCFLAVASRLRREGARAVWGAHASNAASRRAAAKLGFREVGRFVVFSRPPHGGAGGDLGS